MIRLVGIDCATQDTNVGVVSADYDGKICCVAELESKPAKVIDEVKALLKNIDTALLCFDAPLGWPIQLANELVNHQAGQYLKTSANKMFRRITDEVIREKHKKQPLDVGADRIARTAYSALERLEILGNELGHKIPLAWDHNLRAGIWAIEVYPAATAKAHNIELKGYKNKKNSAERLADLLPTIGTKLQLPKNQAFLSTTDHVFDALLCVLAGFDFLSGEAMPPNDDQKQFALKEGWIWVRVPSKPLAAK